MMFYAADIHYRYAYYLRHTPRIRRAATPPHPSMTPRYYDAIAFVLLFCCHADDDARER